MKALVQTRESIACILFVLIALGCVGVSVAAEKLEIGNTNRYVLRAGGINSVTVITNAPSSNKATVSFKKWSNDGLGDPAIFCVTNSEPVEISIWNIRVQVRSKGKGTDGKGWDTVSDDYFGGVSDLAPGAFCNFPVTMPFEGDWRVCLLFSKRRPGFPITYAGNFEIVSELMK